MEGGPIGRRDFIKKMAKGIAGVAVVSATPNILNALEENASASTEETSIEEPSPSVTDRSQVNSPFFYKTEGLVGHKFGDLYSDYTGINGTVPPSANINFHEQLRILNEKKVSYAETHDKPDTAFKSCNQRLLKEYSDMDPERTNFESYQKDIKFSIREVIKNIDWNIVQKKMNLSNEELFVLVGIAKSLLAKHLTACAFTELLPAPDGRLNKNVFNFLLKNAGSRYIYSLPAVHDVKASFGPYQFTSFALKDDGDEVVGASIINHALPESKRICRSVDELRDLDHHKAALLFSIYNLSHLIRELNSKQLATLRLSSKNNITAVVQFIATAHHSPEHAITAAKRWLDSGAKKQFEVSCHDSLRLYAHKTRANLAVL
ncbi:MAG: hypothetical protein WCP17_01685 [bacterium]